GRVVSLPIKGATINSCRPSPSRSAKFIRCVVGYSMIGCSVHCPAGLLPPVIHWIVPPLLVFVGCQSAPTAKSSRPSPSMSYGACHVRRSDCPCLARARNRLALEASARGSNASVKRFDNRVGNIEVFFVEDRAIEGF